MHISHSIYQPGPAENIVEAPFDPRVHTWSHYYGMTDAAWKAQPVSLYRESPEPEKIFEELEQALKNNDCALLKQAVTRETGIIDPKIGGIKICIVNRGVMQIVVRLDVGIQNEHGQFVASCPLMAIITAFQGSAAQQYSIHDYQTIAKCRTSEALALGRTEDDPEYDRRLATFPPRYGESMTPGGHHVQLSRFMQGFYEVNMHAEQGNSWIIGDNMERRLVLNMYTHRERGGLLNEEENHRVLGKIMVHQFETALRLTFAVSPSFSAGDYLWSPGERRLMLHTAPEREHDHDTSAWQNIKKMYQVPLDDIDPKILAAADQIITMVLSREINIDAARTKKDQATEKMSYYTYGMLDLMVFAEKMIQAGIFTEAEWQEVFRTIKRWTTQIYNAMVNELQGKGMEKLRKISPHAIAFLTFSGESQKRLNDLIMMVATTFSTLSRAHRR